MMDQMTMTVATLTPITMPSWARILWMMMPILPMTKRKILTLQRHDGNRCQSDHRTHF